MSLLDTFAGWLRETPQFDPGPPTEPIPVIPPTPHVASVQQWLTGRADAYDQDADHNAAVPGYAVDAREANRKLQRAVATELRDCARDLGEL